MGKRVRNPQVIIDLPLALVLQGFPGFLKKDGRRNGYDEVEVIQEGTDRIIELEKEGAKSFRTEYTFASCPDGATVITLDGSVSGAGWLEMLLEGPLLKGWADRLDDYLYKQIREEPPWGRFGGELDVEALRHLAQHRDMRL